MVYPQFCFLYFVCKYKAFLTTSQIFTLFFTFIRPWLSLFLVFYPRSRECGKDIKKPVGISQPVSILSVCPSRAM